MCVSAAADLLQSRITELDASMKHKSNALAAARQSRDQARADATAEVCRARDRAKQLLSALTSQKGDTTLLKAQTEDAETRVSYCGAVLESTVKMRSTLPTLIP